MSLDMSENLAKKLKEAIINCEETEAEDLAKEIVKLEVNPLDIIKKYLSPAMKIVGEKFEKSLINILANKRDDLFRRGSNFFIQPFMKTTKTYRELWYNYEVFLCENLYNETKQKINKTS